MQRYAEDLLRDRIMEESIGNDDIVPNIDKILTNSFMRLDNDLAAEALPEPSVNGGRANVTDKETLDVIMSGSCACVALLSGKELYVANCGDARAIIGQENDDGTFSAFRMSNEHNVENSDEVKRLLKEHPNEQNTIIRFVILNHFSLIFLILYFQFSIRNIFFSKILKTFGREDIY